MVRRIALISTFFLLPLSAGATSAVTLGIVSCTDSLTVSVLELASISCTGNLSLADSSITSDSKILITAYGSLLLENLFISAPLIELNALNGTLSIGTGVLIRSDSFSAQTYNSPTVSSGATLTIGSDVAPRVIRSAELLSSITPGSITLLDSGNISVQSSVPEPGTYVLMLSGLLLVLGIKKSRYRDCS